MRFEIFLECERFELIRKGAIPNELPRLEL